MSPLFSHSALQEEQHWVTMAKKNISHFRPLYEKYHAPIFRFIYRRTDDEELTADLCSQTFFKAMTKISQFQWTGKPFGAWLYRIASNEIKKHFRDKKELFIIEEDRILKTPELKEEWERNDQETILKILDTLDEDELQLIELKYFEGLTFIDISSLLGIKESAIKMRLYRLLNKLRQRLEVDNG